MTLTTLIKQAIVSEKTLNQAKQNCYTFKVARQATKPQIKQAIETTFGVKVASVTTSTSPAQQKKVGRRRLPRLIPATKKATIQLKPGQKIDLLESIGNL